MKLILTRHAKSSWDDLMLDDHDRPLNERGRAAASRMGAWVAGRRHVPHHVICSTAERAVETCNLMIAEMGADLKVSYEPGLYHATADTMLAQINKAPAGDLMVVGHNPGIANLAQMILDVSPTHDRFGIYPTTATLIAEFSGDNWADLKFGDARVVQFIVPRELKELHTA